MKTAVHITIDTESAMAGAWEDPGRRPVPASRHIFCENESGAHGIPLIMARLQRYGFRATFFCETLAGRVLGEADTRSVVEALLTGGQDVQLHLHPVYWHYSLCSGDLVADRARYRASGSDLLGEHSAEQQIALIEAAADLFRASAGRAPTVFRAGNFAASRVTLRLLAKLGFVIDSSFNAADHEALSLADERPEPNTVQNIEGVWELPVTVARSRIREGNGYKPFDPVALSVGEMRTILETAHANSMPHVTLVFHCFSLVKPRDMSYSRFRLNRVVIARLQALLAFLDVNRSRFTVQTLGELAAAPDSIHATSRAVIPDLGFWRPAARKAVQAVNRLYWV
jgi:hypothetical protein